MSVIKEDRKYTKTHEWVLDNGDGTFTMGITDNAQEQLGDMVFVELPEVGAIIEAEETVGVVESVKAASDIYAPTNLEVISINENLEDSPEFINSNCYDDGYLFNFKAEHIDNLLSATQYQDFLENE
jgi:glycine cleavage system H protein